MNMRTRIAELALGYTVSQLAVWSFEFALYPFVVFSLGLWRGGAMMAGLSFVICWLTIKFYDWSQRDWLGIEAIKALREYGGKQRGRRLLAWALRTSDPVACVLLSIKFDPFIVTAYLRRGRFGGMTARDWRIFMLSWSLGNAFWGLLCFAGTESLAGLWRCLAA